MEQIKTPKVDLEMLRRQPPEFVEPARETLNEFKTRLSNDHLRIWFNTHWPARYRQGMDERMSIDNVETALCWDWTKGRNLILVGESGAGKTWLAWQVVKKHVLDFRLPCEAVLESRLAVDVGDRAMGGALGKYLDEICAPKILFLDDIGKAPPTERFISSLYHIAEMRHSRRKPIIITTQFGEADMIKRLASRDASTANAEAIVRRLSEDAEVIQLKVCG